MSDIDRFAQVRLSPSCYLLAGGEQMPHSGLALAVPGLFDIETGSAHCLGTTKHDDAPAWSVQPM